NELELLMEKSFWE
nr:Chain E, DNA replication ATP-dependent helicase/nuclease DNA2 [Homo sapiens]5EAY_F Chain F, DNA replication ATP-dependent helicase/nuclease DNA2 [Homo sapiens]5EAY_G Chain G, DNA replication ATP-dependent helicase/nuclease DNA2 [Homo sapiens]5EAY_H Chain H, DNA replication ATP-dependent helicase/nuclease DNA2 [Homo sapiens]